MTPAARTQAAIEVLEAVIDAARGGGAPADAIVQRYFATRRYAGSKDRRAVRDLVYAGIRACGEIPASGRATLLALATDDPALASTFDGSTHGPAPIAPGEPVAQRGVAPGWLIERLTDTGLDGGDLAALIERAPLDLRVNTLVPGGDPPGEPVAGLSDARRLANGTDVGRLDGWRDGAFEVQDAGSQAVTLAVQAAPGEAVVDLCAGGGGKALALAAAMADRGTILACDVDRQRLSKLSPRAARAQAAIIEPRLLDAGREAAALADWSHRADAVLVDAPCSGTGTWRRNPEARWRLTPARLDQLVATQAMLLDLAATLVRPGGRLVYIVCSLLDEEGAGQVARFFERHSGWAAEPPGLPLGRRHRGGWRLTPAGDATDGFFVARLRAPC